MEEYKGCQLIASIKAPYIWVKLFGPFCLPQSLTKCRHGGKPR